MKMKKSWLVAIAVGTLCGSLQAEVSPEAAKEISHRITYGFGTGTQKQGEFAEDTTYSGIYVRYHLASVNAFNLQANFDGTTGTVKLKNNAGNMSSAIGELELLGGYNFATPVPHLTVAPMGGLYIWSESNRGKTANDIVEVDVDAKFNAYMIGALATYQVLPQLELGLAAKIAFARNAEKEETYKILGVSTPTKTDYENLTYYKMELPVSYTFIPSFGAFAMYEQTFGRKFTAQTKGADDADLNAWKFRIGLLHRF